MPRRRLKILATPLSNTSRQSHKYSPSKRILTCKDIQVQQLLVRRGHGQSSHGNKKLSCRRKAARCLMSLNIWLSPSRSLDVIENGTISKAWSLGYGFLFAFHINYDRIFSRLDTTHERDRHAARQTDITRRHKPRLCIASRCKNASGVMRQ